MKKISGLVLVVFFSFNSNAQSECINKLSVDSFQIVLKEIKEHDFDQAKKESIEILLNKCLTSLQLKKLLQELSFEEDKLELAKKDTRKFQIRINLILLGTSSILRIVRLL